MPDEKTRALGAEAERRTQPGHYVELVIESGELRRNLRCTMPADAPCRRRPADMDGRESWTAEEATLTGFECWAVDWVEAVGIEDAVTGEDGVLASVPVSVTYDEGVVIEPAPSRDIAGEIEAEIKGEECCSPNDFHAEYVDGLRRAAEIVRNGR